MSANLLLILVLLLAGFACAQLRILERGAADAFHTFVIYVCLPATIWKLLPTLRFVPELWLLVGVPWALLVCLTPVVVWLAQLWAWPRTVCGALLLCVPLGNTSFLGFPLISALLGEASLRYAVLYDQLGSFLGLATFGLFVAARYGSGATPSPAQTLRRILRFPPMIALLLAFTPLPRWPPLQPLWGRLSDLLVPLAMFAVGLRLSFRLPAPRSAFLCGLALKLVAMPGLAWLLARAFHAQLPLLRVVVLEAGMPSMITAGAVATVAGLAPELAGALVGYGVVLGLFGVAMWAVLLGVALPL